MITNIKNKNIHLIGIGGAGMSGLAHIFLDLGFHISGSDLKPSPITDILVQRGAQIFFGHHRSNIHKDLAVVVYSNAVPQENPEIKQAIEFKIPIIPRAELLKELIKLKKSIGITGTHGKTTTSSMISSILEQAHYKPSVLLGASTHKPYTNGYLGEGEYLVYEACEAFASIDYMSSDIAIITNIDNDHMDYYQNMDNLLETFLNYIHRTPYYGIVLLNGDDPYTRQILPSIYKPFMLCGLSSNNDLYADNIIQKGFSSSFEVVYKTKKVAPFVINIPGKHNIYNALLSIAVGLYLDISIEDIQIALKGFKSPYRRFELYGQYNGAYIIDDYAHHPTEVKATLQTAQEIKQQDNTINRLIVIFQPHLYSRTKEHLKDFALALIKADYIILAPIYGAREINSDNISSQILADELSHLNFNNYYIAQNLEDALDHTHHIITPNDIVMTMGAGNVYQIAQKLIDNNHA